MIIMTRDIINRRGIIIIILMERKEAIQGKKVIIVEVEVKMKVIVINIILNIANINTEKKNMIQIAEQKKKYRIKINHTPHRIQSRILPRVLHIQINLPCYIPIQ